MDFRTTKPGPPHRETTSRGIIWQIIFAVVGGILIFSLLWARPGLLPFSSQTTKQTTNKVSSSPAKVTIKATIDPEELSPSPSPSPHPSPPPTQSSTSSPSATKTVTSLPSTSKTSTSSQSETTSTESSTTTSTTAIKSQTPSSLKNNNNEEEEDEDDYTINEEDYDYDDENEDYNEEEDDGKSSSIPEKNLISPGVRSLPTTGQEILAPQQMMMNTNLTDPSLRSTLFALSKCRKYECIKKLHYEIDGRTRFNFPHFFLIGWQKCATTSINSHLKSHPQFLPSVFKESHWFTVCQSSRTNTNCRAPSLRKYLLYFLRIQDAALGGLERATIDASVDYAWKGRSLSKEIHDLFPWLKIVMMMREPISRMISYTRMFTIKEVRGKGCMPPKTIFGCLQKGLSRESAVYANALEAWLDAFPAEQIHVIQFEEMQEDSQKVLNDLKVFLGMDTHLPVQEELRNVNSRRGSGGYALTLEEYQSLIALVRPGAERVAKMLGDKGIKNEKEWLGRWESVWNKVIEESCDADGQCEVNSNR